MDGATSTKADVLSRLDRHERRREPYLITATNMRQHLFGDTACVTYTKVYTKPGSTAAYSENVLHVLIRRNGIWRLQVSSPLPAPSPDLRTQTFSPQQNDGCPTSRLPFGESRNRFPAQSGGGVFGFAPLSLG